LPPERALLPLSIPLSPALPLPLLFKTYTNAIDFRPGPKLNLIIGPNGAGKSSLVCAICIGLGGAPRLLGRAREVREYVRRGAPGGWVELTLAGGPSSPPIVVRRDLSAVNNTSTWRLDGLPATPAAVAACVANLRIQLDNLCQFLPQDRVADLARLPPSALLEETERALGDASLHALHADLAAAVGEEREARSRAAALGAEAGAADRAQETGRAEAARAERVSALNRRAEAARGKAAWLRAAAASDEAAHATAVADRARELLAQAERGRAGAAAAGAAAVAVALESARGVAVVDHTHASHRLGQAERALRKAVKDGPDAVRDAVEAAREALAGAPAAAAAHADRLRTTRAAVEKARDDLLALPAEGGASSVDEEARAVRAALQVSHEAAMAADRRAATAAAAAGERVVAARARAALLDGALRRAGDARARRTRALQSTAVAAAVARSGGGPAGPGGQWEGPVWGPLGTELVIAHPGAAAAAEAATPFHVLRRFVVTTRSDQERLNALIKDLHETNPVSMVDPAARAPPPRSLDLDTPGLRDRGLTTLADAVEGPAPVLRALADDVRLGQVMLVPRDVDGPAADEVGAAAKAAGAFAVVFLGGGGPGGGGPTVHRFTTSRYTRAVATTIESLPHPRTLGPDAHAVSRGPGGRPASGRGGGEGDGGGDSGGGSLEERAAAARAELAAAEAVQQAAEAARTAASQALDFESSRLRTAMRAAASVADKRKAAQTRLAGAVRALALVEAAPDPAAAAADAAEALAAAAGRAPAALARVKDAAAALAAASSALAVAAGRRAELEQAKRAAERARLAATAELDRAAATVATAAAAQAAAVRDEERAIEAAEAATGGPLEAWPLASEAGDLPGTLEELRDVAEAAEAALAGIAPTDSRALERWAARAAAAARLRESAAAATADAAAAAATAARLRAAWAPALRALLATVSSRFGDAMRALGCDGRVDLGDDDPSGDPAAARADVSVRFRPGEPLARLDGARQSGGERSIATILYLVALQAVSASPFRVVDEINQGMDPVNERAVFELLAREAAGAGAPQVLLLTPKLLPGLPLADPAVTVLQVVNGPVGPGVGGPMGRVDAADFLPQGGGAGPRAVGVAG